MRLVTGDLARARAGALASPSNIQLEANANPNYWRFAGAATARTGQAPDTARCILAVVSASWQPQPRAIAARAGRSNVNGALHAAAGPQLVMSPVCCHALRLVGLVCAASTRSRSEQLLRR